MLYTGMVVGERGINNGVRDAYPTSGYIRSEGP